MRVERGCHLTSIIYLSSLVSLSNPSHYIFLAPLHILPSSSPAPKAFSFIMLLPGSWPITKTTKDLARNLSSLPRPSTCRTQPVTPQRLAARKTTFQQARFSKSMASAGLLSKSLRKLYKGSGTYVPGTAKNMAMSLKLKRLMMSTQSSASSSFASA